MDHFDRLQYKRQIDEGKKDEARTVLQQLQQAPVDPDWAPEDREFKAKGLVLVKAVS